MSYFKKRQQYYLEKHDHGLIAPSQKKLETCGVCRRRFTRAMMLDITQKAGLDFRCIRCFNSQGIQSYWRHIRDLFRGS
jgi:hypothetical protein